jgi:hypothetical protein
MRFRNKIILPIILYGFACICVSLAGSVIVYAFSSFEFDESDKVEKINADQRAQSSETVVLLLGSTDNSDAIKNTNVLPASSANPGPGRLQIPYVGIETESISPGIAELLNLNPSSRGEMVTHVVPGGPGERSGVEAMNFTQISNTAERILTKVGDIILMVEDSPSFAIDFDSLEEYIYENKLVGENVTLTVLRDGQVKDIELSVATLPGFLWYENEDKEFKLKYPTDWVVQGDKSNTTEGRIVEFNPLEKKGSSKEPVASVAVIIYPSNANGTAESNENSDTGNIRILNSSTTTLGNVYAYSTVFNDYSMKDVLKVLSVFAVKGTLLYRIDYSADLSSYDDYLPLATEMVSSFRFLE